MEKVRVTRDDFLRDRQGKTFSDVVHDTELPFDKVLEFFDDGAATYMVRDKHGELVRVPQRAVKHGKIVS